MVEVVLLFYSLEGDGPFIACLDPLHRLRSYPLKRSFHLHLSVASPLK